MKKREKLSYYVWYPINNTTSFDTFNFTIPIYLPLVSVDKITQIFSVFATI